MPKKIKKSATPEVFFARDVDGDVVCTLCPLRIHNEEERKEGRPPVEGNPAHWAIITMERGHALKVQSLHPTMDAAFAAALDLGAVRFMSEAQTFG